MACAFPFNPSTPLHPKLLILAFCMPLCFTPRLLSLATTSPSHLFFSFQPLIAALVFFYSSSLSFYHLLLSFSTHLAGLIQRHCSDKLITMRRQLSRTSLVPFWGSLHRPRLSLCTHTHKPNQPLQIPWEWSDKQGFLWVCLANLLRLMNNALNRITFYHLNVLVSQ